MAPGLLKRFQLWSWPAVTAIWWLPSPCPSAGKPRSRALLALELAG